MDRDSDDFPRPLRDELSALYRADVPVPSDVDQQVTSRARAHFARRGRWVRWTTMVGAAAAAIVVSIVLSRPETAEPTRITDDFAIRIGDADRNNTIDIRDALALARKIEGGDVKWTRWEDVNQDKVVDRQDVDAVAMLAVRIEPEAVR